ncbi:nuclear transport factor 2 family protein [Pseudohaliea sp.]|uniref:nuclear transport factor 2 family protein n=1 Tax=Pseudohaliea sp. TaxID=2740289 RepID=UPI0032EC445E
MQQTPDMDAFLGAYAAAWASSDPEAIGAHWDRERAPLYQAEEKDEPFTTWAELDDYWAANAEFHDSVRLQFTHPKVQQLAGGLCQVLVQMRWDIRFTTGASRAMGGTNRVLATLVKTQDGWRLCGWVEAPLAPITYLRRLYEQSAASDLQ